MSNEVDFLIDQVASVAGSNQPSGSPLWRVDRDESLLYEGSSTVANSSPTHTVDTDLEAANFVGFALENRAPEPIGTEYDHRIETTVSLRLEGVHHTEYGNIDPDGTDGVDWETLKSDVRGQILGQRTYPSAGGSDFTYTHLELQNENDQSSDYSDYYRYDVDVVFVGFETI